MAGELPSIPQRLANLRANGRQFPKQKNNRVPLGEGITNVDDGKIVPTLVDATALQESRQLIDEYKMLLEN